MHLKKLSVVLMATVMFILSMFGTAYADNPVGIVTASSLNVRAHADAYAEILAEISQGSQVVLIERVNDWYKINIGFEGYVNAAYIKTPEEIEAANSMAAPTAATAMAATSTTLTMGQKVVETAKLYLGVKYVYGGSSPNGFDCSGLTQYVYRQLGASINRVAADQANNGIYVAKEDLQPGDLVFFKKSGRAIHHVGIYVGDGMYLHAPQTGRVVSIDPMTRSDYYTARRIFY